MILVTGGAGYIGSHTVHQLVERGEKVVVVDDLRTGHEWAIPPGVPFEKGDIGDVAFVSSVLKKHSVQSVIHFAALLDVEESMRIPDAYYANNVAAGLRLLEACRTSSVGHFIFSSTCAVYGTPDTNPVTERTPTLPVSTYGKSKLSFEWILRDLEIAGQLKFRTTVLRYFNVAGARKDSKLGQLYRRPTQLVSAAAAVASGKLPLLNIYGTDYPTQDGTCIRDYIHVEDLAHCHVLALDYLRKGGPSEIFNCGSGTGFSVRDVVDTFRRVNDLDFKVVESPRRPGDAVAIYADISKVSRILQWAPQRDLDEICRSAWRWETEGKPRVVRA